MSAQSTILEYPRWLTRIAFVLSVTVTLFALADELSSSPRLTGDGGEYLAYIENLARGNGVNIVEIPKELPDARKLRLLQLRDGHSRPVGTGTYVRPFFRDDAGGVFTYHWWGYAAFCLPAFLILEKLGINPLRSFAVTNWMFLALLLTYLARFSRQSDDFRAVFACLFLLSGTTFYLWWSGPEVMSAALVALGLVAWLDRRTILSILCIAIAATQNPPLALLTVFPGATEILTWRTIVRTGDGARTATIHLLAASMAGLIAVIPSVWYFDRIGVLNPIMAIGWARLRSDNLSKAVDIFFGLNQGMILLQVGSFAAIAINIIVAAYSWRNGNVISRDASRLVMSLLAVTYVMAALASSTTNWNAGSIVIARYAYWLSIPLIFVAGQIVTRVSGSRMRNAAGSLLLATASALICLWGFSARRSDYLQLTEASLVAMRLMPRGYFPHPEEFCERVQRTEVCDFKRMYIVRKDGWTPLRVLVEKRFLMNLCDGRRTLERPTKAEQYGGRTLLWFSGPVTCSGGRRLDELVH